MAIFTSAEEEVRKKNNNYSFDRNIVKKITTGVQGRKTQGNALTFLHDLIHLQPELLKGKILGSRIPDLLGGNSEHFWLRYKIFWEF